MTKQKHFYLIRGLIREARHWANFPQEILKLHPDAKLTTIDIPGAGDFFQEPSPLTIKKMVEQMRQSYLKAHQVDEESILVAISLGGMISAQWMKAHPEDFNKAILINTSYGGVSPFYKRIRMTAFSHLLSVFAMKGREKEAHILKLVTNHTSIFDKTLDLWEGIQKERPVSVSNTLRQLTAAATFRIGKFKPLIPVLILGSTEDRMVSVDCSRAIARLWNAKIEEHPTGGHDLTADDPEWVAKTIHQFVTA
jgi:pimeloyl-[acyl-carrier protein] methyl ester esterase